MNKLVIFRNLGEEKSYVFSSEVIRKATFRRITVHIPLKILSGLPTLTTFQYFLLLVLLNVAGCALGLPGDVEEEGFCIDGDVVAGFCLGAEYAETVQESQLSKFNITIS